MMYISLIEALSGLPGYEGAEVCKTLYIYNLKLFIMSYYTHYVPFDKRNMCFGDNPIEIKVY